MRTNIVSFALTTGMGLIVLLLGFAALSAGGLVQLVPVADVGVEPQVCGNKPLKTAGTQDSAAVPVVFAQQAGQGGGDAVTIAAGDALFKNNCAQCHAVNDKVVGPALAGITKRRTISWIIPWVHNSSRVIAAGDEYAVKLFEDNGKQQMPAFPQLSEKDIKAIMAWVDSWQAGAATTTAPAVAIVE